MTKVEPLVEKGRSPEVSMTGGAPIPPRAPAKVWIFVPEAAVAVATAVAVVVAPAPTVVVIITVTVEMAEHASVAAAAVVAATTTALVVMTVGAVEEVPETPRAALKASAAA